MLEEDVRRYRVTHNPDRPGEILTASEAAEAAQMYRNVLTLPADTTILVREIPPPPPGHRFTVLDDGTVRCEGEQP